MCCHKLIMGKYLFLVSNLETKKGLTTTTEIPFHKLAFVLPISLGYEISSITPSYFRHWPIFMMKFFSLKTTTA